MKINKMNNQTIITIIIYLNSFLNIYIIEDNSPNIKNILYFKLKLFI